MFKIHTTSWFKIWYFHWSKGSICCRLTQQLHNKAITDHTKLHSLVHCFKSSFFFSHQCLRCGASSSGQSGLTQWSLSTSVRPPPCLARSDLFHLCLKSFDVKSYFDLVSFWSFAPLLWSDLTLSCMVEYCHQIVVAVLQIPAILTH